MVIQHVASEKSIYEIREKIIQELLQANERFLIIKDKEKIAIETFIKNMEKQINKENKSDADLH